MRFKQVIDIVTFDDSHVTKQYAYLYVIHVIYVKSICVYIAQSAGWNPILERS